MTRVFSVNRVILNTGWKCLGADLGVQAIVPVIHARVSADMAGTSGDKHRTGVGDLRLEPTLQWYPTDRLSILASAALFLPIGDYRKNAPVNPCSGSFGFMGSLGGNYFLGAGKTVLFSPIFRYEKSTRQRSTDIRAGDYLHFEASLLKKWDRWSAAFNLCGT